MGLPASLAKLSSLPEAEGQGDAGSYSMPFDSDVVSIVVCLAIECVGRREDDAPQSIVLIAAE